jgi:hypothetical protein
MVASADEQALLVPAPVFGNAEGTGLKEDRENLTLLRSLITT